MNAIVGYTRILLRQAQESLNARHYKNLENVQLSANNLLSLINDILDLSKIEAGHIDLKPEDIDLKQLAVECSALAATKIPRSAIFPLRLGRRHQIPFDSDLAQFGVDVGAAAMLDGDEFSHGPSITTDGYLFAQAFDLSNQGRQPGFGLVDAYLCHVLPPF